MKVGVVQFNAGRDKERNLKRALGFIEEAARKGAEFVVLPEVFIFRGNLGRPDVRSRVTELIPGPTTRAMGEAAAKWRVSILAGSILEKRPGKRKIYNTSFLLGKDGKLKGTYRKINLFTAKIGKQTVNESVIFAKGFRSKMTKVENFSVGMSICYDLRFPEIYQRYARKGADVLLIPSAFTSATGQAHWESLLRARAIENLCYVLAPNQVGQDFRGIPSHGHSMIIDPWGEILSRASENKEEIIFARLSRKRLTEARRNLPGINYR